MYDHRDIVHCVVTRSSGRTNIEHVWYHSANSA